MRVDRGQRNGHGFTLLEVLAAIVVLGVAVSIFFQLFTGAIDLKESAGKSRTAARIAEEILTVIRSNPDAYEWPRFEEAAPGALIPLYAKGAQTHVATAGLPLELPTDRRANERTKSLYNNITTETYTSMAAHDAHHAAVIVVVVWTVEGKKQSFSLTTTVPRSVAEG